MNMKKIFAGVLALTAAVSLATPSFAAAAAKPTTRTVAAWELRHENGAYAVKPSLSKPEDMAKLKSKPDVVKPGKMLYYRYTDSAGNPINLTFADASAFKFTVAKGDNAKLIKSVKLVEKKVGTKQIAAIEIQLNSDTSDKEYKMNPSVILTAKQYVTALNGVIIGVYDTAAAASAAQTTGAVVYQPGEPVEKVQFSFWISNASADSADRVWSAPIGGASGKPIANEKNQSVWTDGNEPIAKLTYNASSEATVYYSKLSTKWDDDAYAAQFSHTDAFMRNFVGNPPISSTSRGTLLLYNPFVDEDGALTIDPDDIVIYEASNGRLTDVSNNFSAATDGDGVHLLVTRVRELGTYILSAEPVKKTGK